MVPAQMLDERISSPTNADHISVARCYSLTDMWQEIPTIANRQKIIITPGVVIMGSRWSWLIEVPLGISGCSPWVKVPEEPSLSPSFTPMSTHLLCHTLSKIIQCAQCLGDKYPMCVYTYVHVCLFPCMSMPVCVYTYVCVFPANQIGLLL